ncbi:acetyl-CoA carboxylase biotin carboxyl carrier protein subunit [Komagataeibacter rhaeticus]|nr:acetyl-CoA carboxylase biotin carboxyl carrier protein subunit [Komagataeibacter rhaeticus]
MKEGQQVGLVEAMKVFNAVKATLAGRITEILVEDGAEVEAGTPCSVWHE